MTIQDEIAQLRSQGTPDDVISQLLTRRGYPAPEIAQALTTSSIKDAVTAPAPGDQDLQPSLASQASPEPAPYPTQDQEYQYSDQPAYQYQDQSQGYGGVSGDTITEIAEQVVAEKMNRAEQTLTQLTLFKSTTEAQVRSLDERLKRIESSLDKLQLALLQRVGEYLTNVEDVKRELIETQKTFKAVTNKPQSTQKAKHAPSESE
jgi:hypothetical protein